MSAQATSWASRQCDLTPGSKLLLLILANAADPRGVAWTSRRAQAEGCCCRPATVTDNMKRLEEAGLVARVERRRPNGSRTSDYIVLAPGAEDRGEMQDASPDEYSDERVLALATGGGTETVPGGVRFSGGAGVRFSGGPEQTVEEQLLEETHLEGRTATTESVGRRGNGAETDQVLLDVPEERVDRFLAFYKAEVEKAQGEPLKRFDKPARAAARELLALHPDAPEVAAVLRFALGDRWYGDKVLTVPKFKQHYPKVRVKWAGTERGRAKAAQIRAERGEDYAGPPPARSVTYD